MTRRLFIALVVLGGFAAHAESGEDLERHRAYAWARVSRSVEVAREGVGAGCGVLYRALSLGRRVNPVYVLGGAVGATAVVATSVIAYQKIALDSAERTVLELMELPLGPLSDLERAKVADALARDELKWMEASHDFYRDLSTRLWHAGSKTGNREDAILAFRLGQLHDEALRASGDDRLVDRRWLESPEEGVPDAEYLPIWKIYKYEAVRGEFFYHLLRESSASTVGEALDSYLYNGAYGTLQPLGWSPASRTHFKRKREKRNDPIQVHP